MTAKVKQIAEQIKALPKQEMDEFLSWLADYEAECADKRDQDSARGALALGERTTVAQGS